MKGIIKTLKENGFGFIKAEGMESDLFFHRNALVGVEFDALKEGVEVTFEVEKVEKNGQMKSNAVNVQVA